MKVLKVNTNGDNAYNSIVSSMTNDEKISVCNSLDACGCTGNGLC